MPDPPLRPDQADELVRISHLVANASNIIERVSNGVGSWRQDGRIALGHLALAQTQLAIWMIEQERSEQEDWHAAARKARP